LRSQYQEVIDSSLLNSIAAMQFVEV